MQEKWFISLLRTHDLNYDIVLLKAGLVEHVFG